MQIVTMNKKERKEMYAAFEQLFNDKNHEYLADDCKFQDLGENMKLLCKSVCGWWKPIILFDCKAKTAMLFINPEDLTLQNVEDKDIDWNSLRGLDNAYLERAKSRIAIFPTNIRGFRHGTAEVEWELNPDGRFYMDDDGFGMTDDEEVSLIGRIDREGKVVKRFTLR